MTTTPPNCPAPTGWCRPWRASATRTGAAYVEGEFASGSVYVKDGVKTAVVYNPGAAKTVKVHVDGQVKEIAVGANSLASYPLQ